jgi:hypothetical protein
MRTVRTVGLSGFLPLLLSPLCLVAASVPNFPPNPVGEKLYRTQLYHETLLPVALFVCALVAVYIVHRISEKGRKAHTPTDV